MGLNSPTTMLNINIFRGEDPAPIAYRRGSGSGGEGRARRGEERDGY